MTRELHIVGNEDRRCLECGAVNLRCPPERTACRWCGGRLVTPESVWAK